MQVVEPIVTLICLSLSFTFFPLLLAVMNNEFSLLSDMQQDCKLYGMVELDQLRSMWKPRKYPIEVAVSLVQSGLLPSIFDWALIGQLMPAEQSLGEMMLQQRINDLELLNSLTTSLQRIQILPESGVEVDVVMGRPSYNVQVQDDGKIVVKELPSLHIHIYAVEPRAAAGQEGGQEHEHEHEQEQEHKDANVDEAIEASKVEVEAVAEAEHDETAPGDADNDADNVADADADDTDTDTKTEAEEIMRLDELNATTMTRETATATTTTTTTTTTTSTDPEEEQHRMINEATSEGEGARVGGGGGTPASNPTEDFLPFFEDSATLTDVEDPSDYLSEYEEPVDVKLHRRMSFWMRFGNWLRQSMPRLT